MSPDERLFLNVKARDGLKGWLLEKDNARAQVRDVESGRFQPSAFGHGNGIKYRKVRSSIVIILNATSRASLHSA
jgi:hypothetical protein